MIVDRSRDDQLVRGRVLDEGLELAQHGLL